MASTQPRSIKDPNRKSGPYTVSAGIRTYRFAVETNRAGRRYLSIVEERTDGSSEAGFRLVVFQRHIAAFHKEYLKAAKRLEPKLKILNVEEIREHYPNAFKMWTPDEEQQLITKFHEGADVLELSQMFGRKPGGIRNRLRTLGVR